MAVKTLSRSFAGGEISPQLFSRVDLDKFQTGAALVENMIVTPQGQVMNRPGFQFVSIAKYPGKRTRLLPFSFSTQQTFALEFGDFYIRLITDGALVLENAIEISGISIAATAVFATTNPHGFVVGNQVKLGPFVSMPALAGRWVVVSAIVSPTQFNATYLESGLAVNTVGMPAFAAPEYLARVLEIVTPYPESGLALLNVVQSADVLTIVTPDFAPRELRRYGNTDWRLEQIQFTTALAAPSSNGAVPSAITHTYRVVPIMQSSPALPSAPASCSNDLTIPGAQNAIGWTSVPGATGYYVYKQIGAAWVFIGISVSSPSFVDDRSVVPNPSVPLYSAPGPVTTVTATAVLPFSTGVSVAPTGGGAVPYTYAVTSLNADASEESLASAPVTVNNDLNIAGQFNRVRWPAVQGVGLYNVYRSLNGIFGFIGRAGPDCIFDDRNILPDATTTPPLQLDPFLGAGNYPRAVSYHQQRRVFGGTINMPQSIWMTRSGTEKNLGYSFPSRDDDGITLRVVSREANTIRHMVPMNDLILLTSGGEWQVSAADGGALTPLNVSVRPQGYTGASTVAPVVTNRTILFPQDRGGHIRELEFSWQQQGYQTSDVSILAPHLFDYFTVVQIAFTRSPVPSLWSVRSDGRLLSMTYVPEHEVRAWCQHVTDGVFESICSVAEDDEDVVYAVVRRSIGPVQKRYIERLHTRRFFTPADQFFVDSGLTYSGAPVSEIGGLFHLEGRTVAILADGGVSPPQVVSGGKVSIEAPASKVHVGLPYRARLQTLPLSMQTQALGQGTQKNINKVHLRVFASNGFTAGPSFAKLRPYRTRFTEPFGSPPDLVTDETEIVVDPSWNNNGQLCIEQADPLALMVLGITLEVAVGG